MMCFLLLAVALSGLVLVGVGLYALLTGEISLIGRSVRGPLVRLLGLFLILCPILLTPQVLRMFVGMGMRLGR